MIVADDARRAVDGGDEGHGSLLEQCCELEAQDRRIPERREQEYPRTASGSEMRACAQVGHDGGHPPSVLVP